MSVVKLHLYDVTNAENENANAAVVQINNVTRNYLGVGGIFHGGIEVDGCEWSYGFCEVGSGIYSCQPKKNPMYTYRESITLGASTRSRAEISRTVKRFYSLWKGSDYNLLTRNCCHFCDAFAQELGVKVPDWVNRLAAGADAVARGWAALSSNAQWLGSTLHAYTFGAAAAASTASAPPTSPRSRQRQHSERNSTE